MRWMRDRQLDMQDATTVGIAHEFGEILSSCGECSGGFVTDIKSVNGRERCQGS